MLMHVFYQDGRTPLHWAAGNGFALLVVWLVEQGKANVEAKDKVDVAKIVVRSFMR